MSADTYWSVEDCCWVKCPQEQAPGDVVVPAQRDDEPVQEPVEA
jgi:hypothetical protein